MIFYKGFVHFPWMKPRINSNKFISLAFTSLLPFLNVERLSINDNLLQTITYINHKWGRERGPLKMKMYMCKDCETLLSRSPNQKVRINLQWRPSNTLLKKDWQKGKHKSLGLSRSIWVRLSPSKIEKRM